MPGLMDAHVHPANLDVDITTVPAYPPPVFVHKVSRILENDLRLGFTTLRDAGGLDAGFRAAAAQGLINAPRLFLSIAPLTQTGGHGDKRKPGENAIIPRNSLGVFPAICDDEGQMRRAAREMLRQGADQIKVMADGGILSPTGGPGNPQFTVRELRAAVEAAEAAGSYAMAHVYSSMAVRNCLDAGVRSIEHATLMNGETAKRLADQGAFLVPTLVAFDLLFEKADEIGLRPLWREKLLTVREGALASLAAAHEAGARIASGSDLLGPYQGYKGRELALKAKVMGAMNAIVSATRTTAELLRVEHELGVIAPGKVADMLVIDGNPLDDLSVFEPDSGKILLVMKDGRIVHRSPAFPADSDA
ncbi:MAG: amidohydrolase family protein [Candidatus Accumulibacter sp.]|nr:amidohydrolase family protein [Accumulibacter sp.]